MKALQITLFLFLFYTCSFAQDNVNTRNSILSAGCFQFKESANSGLVFKGPGINYGMNWNFINASRLISYEGEIGAGILFSRQIPGLNFYLKPVDFAYMSGFQVFENNLYIGPALKVEYNYNLYPDLQSGFDYWFSTISFGISTVYDFNYKNSGFNIKFKSSLIGFVSRQPELRDPYFYDLGIKYAIKHMHQDPVFYSIYNFCTSEFELLWKPNQNSRFTFGYILKYNAFYQDPEISIVNHSIRLIISKKQK